jgi:predicted Fe-S protein YdhL (DUF1289 family)
MTDFNWGKMTGDEKKDFIRDSLERHHEARYLAALAFFVLDGAPWAELTDEQREKIREENRRYDREMQEFGESLWSQ